ncbi:MAG: class I SAM-dependent methyltransferase [Candidatus Eisenbacteria bacterium]
MAEWFHELSDDLWLRPDEDGDEEARFVRRALRLRRRHRVLDAPCGAGRLAIHLALAGCVVTCLDIRPQFVGRARRRFRAEGVSGRFAVCDMRETDWRDEFDGIYNWGGSFGYFDDAGNADVIACYARALRPGGRLLIEQPNREHILRDFRHEVTTEKRVSRNRWNRSRERVESRYFVRGVHRAQDRSSMRLYTPGQMCVLFEHAGLRVEWVYGDLHGSRYSRSGQKMIVVGRKEGPANTYEATPGQGK